MLKVMSVADMYGRMLMNRYNSVMLIKLRNSNPSLFEKCFAYCNKQDKCDIHVNLHRCV